MSYIYEALKRAEDENARGAAGAGRVRRRLFFASTSRAWVWALIGVLAANAIVLVTLTVGRRSQPPRATVTATPEPAPDVPPPHQPGPVDITPSAPPAIVPASPAVPAARATAPSPEATARPARPATSAKPSVPPPTRAVPTASRAESARATPAAVAPDPASPRPEPPAPVAPVVAPSPPPPVAATPAPSAIDPSKLHVQVVVYSDVPAERMVIIDGRRYAEGQKLDADTVVESITPTGAVVSRQGQRVTLTSGRP